MLVLYGGSALTSHNQKKLLEATVSAFERIEAVYFYLIQTKEGVSVSSNDLKPILSDLRSDDYIPSGPTIAYVFPRTGTISPWSSKATNIANVCNLKGVNRIERGIAYSVTLKQGVSENIYQIAFTNLFDRMTETLRYEPPKEDEVFNTHEPAPLVTIELGYSKEADKEAAKRRLAEANVKFGLALASDEIDYLVECYSNEPSLKHREPTDVELFMFGQVNSEHCRHKIFNADWTIDGKKMDNSLFKMIRNTHKLNPDYTISAYSDNAAVFEGNPGTNFFPINGEWTMKDEKIDFLGKVETHNHPTAVSPFPGAATGSGGEIRDEGAVGQGSKSKAGLAGYNVSNLHIPGFKQPWEIDVGKPFHIASALDIMLSAPIGSSSFNNEFGRPCINGYFRTLTMEVPRADGTVEYRGYHKPIMAAGGVGCIRRQHAFKKPISPGSPIIVLGGPALLVGLGGGAASSMSSGEGSEDLDFASVQRGNPEMQRRAQMVIDTCTAMEDNIIQSIHDVGAGGVSNALPELVHDAGLGARFELRDIPCIEPSMSPMQIWCCESQERYVLSVKPEDLDLFKGICERERCPYGVVGYATEEQRLILTDRLYKNTPIDLPMEVLFGKPPKMSRVDNSDPIVLKEFDSSLLSYIPVASHPIADAVQRVLHMPAVASKSFLITIGDRSITGLVAREQMVGPWQVPVADVAVTVTSYDKGTTTGEAFAIGEKPITALISSAASARMAVAECIMNMAAASLPELNHIRLSANWMSSPSHSGEGAKLYEAVQAIGLDFCPQLGISIPVGKDSMSMSMKWMEDSREQSVTAPLSLIITGFSSVNNVESIWTPQLKRETEIGPSSLLYIDLAKGKQRLGGSIIAQCYNQLGDEAPDVEDVELLKSFFAVITELHNTDYIQAYHDNSDGGLFVTVSEMAFAGRVGVISNLDSFSNDNIATLFNEELGAVIQVRDSDLDSIYDIFRVHGLVDAVKKFGKVISSEAQEIVFVRSDEIVYKSTRATLQSLWHETSYKMQSIRDNPKCAQQENENILDNSDPGVGFHLTFEHSPKSDLILTNRPKVAVLREQGVNGHLEMAYAFHAAGFTPVDVHMTDIISGKHTLDMFVGIAACGGFSYGDVLGSANGWATSILLHDTARQEFYKFFNERKDTFAIGLCNGCQLFTRLKTLIPGAQCWPLFLSNESSQYEGRTVMLQLDSKNSDNSIFAKEMGGSRIPIAVAHGEGRAMFDSASDYERFKQEGLDILYYVDNYGNRTNQYPFNPNGSTDAIAGIRSPCGRFLAMMPHPERVVLKVANSYYPKSESEKWGIHAPWIRLFQSARKWVG
ncbi:phosphoribosylformylglycinamidine synthase Ade3 [Schizosaccharomyces cryophilus OY26]|uniref:Phosphoribosylformylglycinamidine synthase n=1 Tax=Schizosaccharomyces cryophilus (strain OY26 / ATCC MYA-4695 / CBS 11777 / NBRC 106824 / NRRL Y48691) TaxID=653667 RepID=S9VXJ9_SCHCR|nr:phosphoribosylformylglycinamidine synthase Ade3 [Schizosaccharomyces cryophilus OY26]EPY50914.1 phosphoribosylformylglycinamidine synthase Ade3 [Schizosaccharomyces cryophilus OY26]